MLAPFWNPKWDHVGGMFDQKSTQNPPTPAKTSLEPAKTPKAHPKTDFSSMLGRFLASFEWTWGCFRLFFNRQHGPISYLFPTGRRHQAVRLLQSLLSIGIRSIPKFDFSNRENLTAARLYDSVELSVLMDIEYSLAN